MALLNIKNNSITKLESTRFETLGVRERQDLQLWIKSQIDAVLPDVLIISEEFGDWDESNRRIDLLALDRKANIVVIELKRTESGGHMELQAIRYAAMLAGLTLKNAIDTYGDYLKKNNIEGNAEDLLHEFFEEEITETEFGTDTRIVLISADFSQELITTVLWLNDRELNIECIRLTPYKYQDEILLDAQQIIPLKEAQDYLFKLRGKNQQERKAHKERIDWNGEFYTNFGHGEARDWEDARKFGFIGAGGGAWYSRTLNALEPNARVWVNVPGCGFVGVGIVTGNILPAMEFTVSTDNGTMPYITIAKNSEEIVKRSERSDTAEYVVPVKWLHTRSLDNAVKQTGFFGNQNSVAKPRVIAWPATVEKLKKEFGVSE